ncbi:fungal trichothecene efflux pump [Cryomyces antarcticus]
MTEEKQDVVAELAHVGHTVTDTSQQLSLKDTGSERAPEARGRNSSEVPAGYWYSSSFIGSYCAVGYGFASATGGYALIAPLLGAINAEIGPDPNVVWVGLVYLLTQTVVFSIVGRLSDIFGRRWFFITGSILGLIGSILGATAHTIPQLIGAEVFIGSAAAFQISFFWVVAELVPMKWRFIANSGAYAFTIPTNALAPKVAQAFQTQTSVRWRGCFYFCIAINVVSVACWYFFYHPPTFKMLHRRRAANDLLLHFDWLGLCLFTGSVLIFVMGLSWGGSVYPWKSGHVIGTIVVGAVVFVIFILWEVYLPLKDSEPFLPIHLFANVQYISAAALTAIGAATYFSFSLIWPQCVNVLYVGLSDSYKGTLFGLVTMGFVFGQIVGGFLATLWAPKPGLILCTCIGGPLLMSAAANPLNMSLTMGLITTGAVFIGMQEGICIAMTTFPLRSQEEIGTAGGLSGTIRSFGSVIAEAIYTTILANRLARTIPALVPAAAENAGLPATSIPALLTGLAGTTNLTAAAVPGLNANILNAAGDAYRLANSQAYQTVFLASFAFGGLGMVLCWFTGGVDKSKDDFVAGHIHKHKEERALEEERG